MRGNLAILSLWQTIRPTLPHMATKGLVHSMSRPAALSWLQRCRMFTPHFLWDNVGTIWETMKTMWEDNGQIWILPADPGWCKGERVKDYRFLFVQQQQTPKKTWCVAFLRDGGYSWKIRWCLAAAAAARPVSFSLSIYIIVWTCFIYNRFQICSFIFLIL